ncbi:hypothetical protein JTE90_015324 [Oedothorax gibbosus]|uniref:Asn/Gln amidotransferase domain-containing protein n=1 Tax=Oedothorax gibbosus TaxID=931172 RepID=A0AAV6VR42_9ARAC|nr:hypothetical protein JTE90_015324 [Oedothorax gibbosus]
MFTCIKSTERHCRSWYCNARFFTSYVLSSDAPKFENRVGLTVHTQLNIPKKLDLKSMRKKIQKYYLEAGILAALACNCSINNISETVKDFNYDYNQSDGQFQNIASKGFIDFVVPRVENQGEFYQHTCNLKHLQLKYNYIDDFYVKETDNSIDSPEKNISIAHLKFGFEPDLKNGTEAACLIEELLSIFNRFGADPCKIEGKCVDFIISVVRNGHTYSFKTGVEQIENPILIQRVIDNELQRQILSLNSSDLNLTEEKLADCDEIDSMQENARDFCMDTSPGQHTLNIGYLQNKLPVLPESERKKLAEVYQIPLNISDKLVKSDGLSEAFKFIVLHVKDKCLVYNFLLKNVLHKLNSRQITFDRSGVTFIKLTEIIQLLHSGQITLETADDILEMLMNGDERSTKEIVENYNWYIISDESKLQESCNVILRRHTSEAKKFRRTGGRHFMDILFNALREITYRISQQQAEEMFKKLIHKKKVIAQTEHK